MTDKKILDLFFARSPDAIGETREKYGEQLLHLAARITGSLWDGEECVNDTLLTAWNKIPPERPEPLLPWLYRTVRNKALNRRTREQADKRGGGMEPSPFEELQDVISTQEGPAGTVEAKELGKIIGDFLAGLPKKDRILFMGRYWYSESYDTLADRLELTQSNCMTRLSRIRKRLRAYLAERGVIQG